MITVLMADDETLIRTAMATMLGLEPDLEVLEHVGSGEELLAAWGRRTAGDEPTPVAVLDLQMGTLDGLDTAAQVLALTPGAGVLIVTSHGRPAHLKRALSIGVRGFLPKTTTAARLAEVIRTVHGGGRYIDPELAAEAISSGDSVLTAREADVLEYALDGASVEQIARRAHLAVGTTRNYLSSAMAKLGATNRYSAAVKAREHGWI